MKERVLRAFPLAIIVTLLIEFIFCMLEQPEISAITIPNEAELLYPKNVSYINGYIEDTEATYVPDSMDPQMGFLFPEQEVQTVLIQFSKPLEQALPIQIFYAGNNENLGEERSVKQTIDAGSILAAVDLPKGCYVHIRLDMDGPFSLNKVYIGPVFPEVKYIAIEPDVMRGCAVCLFLTVVIAGISIVRDRRDLNGYAIIRSRERVIQTLLFVGLVCAAFLTYYILAQHMPIYLAPDEDMRNDIPFWIYEHNALPIGDEVELLSNNVWGFSYGFSPCRLSSILAYGLMRLFAVADASEYSLVLATRFVSVLASTGTVFICIRLGRLLFHSGWSVLLFAAMVGFLPQVVFISSYFNNDAIALFSCVLIFYCWVSGQRQHWPIKTCVGLAVAISCCALSYNNAYGWILGSIIFCILSCLQDKTILDKRKFIASRVLLVAAVVFLLTGWSFIRNAILYHGDFMGMNILHESAKKWEEAGNAIVHPYIPRQEGISIGKMLTDGTWIPVTVKSFIAVFGYMNIFVPSYLYMLYGLIWGVGLLSAAYYMYKSRKNWLLYSILSVEIVIPIILSAILSYSSGYQPQGRYILALLPALAFFVTLGYEKLTIFFQEKGVRYFVYTKLPEVEGDAVSAPAVSFGFNPTLFICILWGALFLVIYIQTMIPSLFI